MTRRFVSLLAIALTAAMGARTDAQGFDPNRLLKPAPDLWGTYSGDYSGRRYSPLTQIDPTNVNKLGVAWATQLYGGDTGGASAPPTISDGEGTVIFGNPPNVRGVILAVDGVLYATSPDNAWALDAHDGHVLWHFFWKTKGGTHIGNRGMAMWHQSVFFETPDDYLICLDARTGKEKWHKTIASFNEQYFSTMAPIVVGNHLLVGTGDDLDEPGILQSFDPETGDVQWKYYTVPMKKGDPGLETWASLDAAAHGGGNVWVPGSYDPETHLYIMGTGNPSAAYTSQVRGPGSNLFTCALVAVNVETGLMAWYYQTSPHDTHDFDSAQTPILADGVIDGKPRKLVLTAARNGYYFTVDRLTGEHIATGKISSTVNWAEAKYDENGAPVRDPEKDSQVGGALISPSNPGVVNWPPPSFNPDTGLFYVQSSEDYAEYYLSTLDPRGAMGLGGKDERSVTSMGSFLLAIDYKTGETVWKHRYTGIGGRGIQNGILNTAGKLLFAGDPSGNLVAYNPANGRQLWHLHTGVSNAPETYMLDGKQYVLVGSGSKITALRLNP